MGGRGASHWDVTSLGFAVGIPALRVRRYQCSRAPGAGIVPKCPSHFSASSMCTSEQPKPVTVRFTPDNVTAEAKVGDNLSSVAERAKVDILVNCAIGDCGSCEVERVYENGDRRLVRACIAPIPEPEEGVDVVTYETYPDNICEVEAVVGRIASMPTVGIFIFDGVEELDFAGPWEVFGACSKLQGDDGVPAAERLRPVTIAASLDKPVECNKGLRVLADHDFQSHPKLDVLLVPGGQGTRRLASDDAALGWIRKVCSSNPLWVSSVCTGSLLLHAAGPAQGKRVATHWAFEEQFRKRGNVDVISNERFVIDGNLVTSQGVSAGIDMSLWLVGQLFTPVLARRVQRYIQYDPQPPYLDVPLPEE